MSLNNITYTFAEFVKVAKLVAKGRHPLMMRGRHGIGKSQVAYQLGEMLSLAVVERRCSQMQEGDFLGLPRTDGTTTDFCPMTWFYECCQEPRLLFLDELDRASEEVRQAAFEVSDSRKIAGHKLHPDTVIISAVNGGIHGAMYNVAQLEPAELDRWTVFDIEPSWEDWKMWAKKDNNISPVLIEFLQEHGRYFEMPAGTLCEPDVVYPSRRSWHRFSQTARELLENDPKSNVNLIFSICNGYCGFEAAAGIREFIAKYEFELSAEDIMEKGKLPKTGKDTPANDLIILIDKIVDKFYCKKLDDNHLKNWTNFFKICPPEHQAKMYSAVMQDPTHGVDNLSSLCKVTIDGQSLALYMAGLFNADKSDD